MWLFSKVSLHIATWHSYQTGNFGLCFALSGTISGQRATLCHIERNLRDSEKKKGYFGFKLCPILILVGASGPLTS